MIFTIKTDHVFPTWLKNFKKPIGHSHRWIELNLFYRNIFHRPGNIHGNAYAMLRLIRPDPQICKQYKMPRDYQNVGPEEVITKCIKGMHQRGCWWFRPSVKISQTTVLNSTVLLNHNIMETILGWWTLVFQEKHKWEEERMVIYIPQAAKQNPETKPSYVTLQNEQKDDSTLGKKLKLKEE